MKTRFQNAEIEAVNNLYAENHLTGRSVKSDCSWKLN